MVHSIYRCRHLCMYKHMPFFFHLKILIDIQGKGKSSEVLEKFHATNMPHGAHTSVSKDISQYHGSCD